MALSSFVQKIESLDDLHHFILLNCWKGNSELISAIVRRFCELARPGTLDFRNAEFWDAALGETDGGIEEEHGPVGDPHNSNGEQVELRGNELDIAGAVWNLNGEWQIELHGNEPDFAGEAGNSNDEQQF